MARFVKLIGTGLNGSGMDRGPKMQVTAVISAMIVICLVLIFFFLFGIAVSIYFPSVISERPQMLFGLCSVFYIEKV